ncbi:uncharacterized protein BKA78DRAFT_157723 [Phyllosticta capitalensis]|uniref:uncharacterized protein n=1 Tax=Phyllosticta capitalensis TaxID=121624 RepID=UPI003131AD29
MYLMLHVVAMTPWVDFSLAAAPSPHNSCCTATPTASTIIRAPTPATKPPTTITNRRRQLFTASVGRLLRPFVLTHPPHAVTQSMPVAGTPARVRT